MAQTIDLAGQRFGRLVAVSIAYRRNGAYWQCRCDCGGANVVRTALLRNGHVRSCGCGAKEQAKLNCKKWRQRNEWIPEQLRSGLKNCYRNMLRRCTDSFNIRWDCYGGRGIQVCNAWIGSDGRRRFYEWALTAGYQKGLQIDRIDVNGHYEPANCRFVDAITQANNTRRNRLITWREKTMSAADWAREFGLSYASMQHRLDRGWPMERIASQPQRVRRNG
jgi:hypothetical protein